MAINNNQDKQIITQKHHFFTRRQDRLINSTNLGLQSKVKKFFIKTNDNYIIFYIYLTIFYTIFSNNFINIQATSENESVIRKNDYYYTRTRQDPQHLRISEEFKNKYIHDIKFESKINGTIYNYYKSSLRFDHDELVFETIDKIFRHRLSPFYIHHYDSERDRKLSSDPKLVSKEACARDLMYLIEKLPTNSNQRANDDVGSLNSPSQLTPELTAFFDSYARQEAGLLMGNTYWVGAYEQCINRHIFELEDRAQLHLAMEAAEQSSQDDPSRLGSAKERFNPEVVDFKGRYCVSALKSPKWDALIQDRKRKQKNYFRSERQLKNYEQLFRLQVGICLPSSCDSASYSRHSDEIKLLTTSMLDARFKDYQLVDLYCLPDESSPLRGWSGSALLFAVFISAWLGLLFLATLADMFEFVEVDLEKKPQGRMQKFVRWFSLRANYNKLMTVKQGEEETEQIPKGKPRVSADGSLEQPEVEKEAKREQVGEMGDGDQPGRQHLKVNLKFLNAFKVLIMFWIVNGHIMLLMIQTAKNILYSDALLNGLMHFLIGATFGVDLFFTMTGFLTSYLIFNSGHAYKMKPATWLYLSFHRYWRLAPMYLLTFWFSKSVMQLLGSGPLWDYGTSSLTFRGLCNHESWWYPLTLTSNLHGLFEECMITSWYISCDMQFWLISPIYIYLLAKSPLQGWLASLATIIMSSKVRYDEILKQESSARYDELVQPRADIFMRVSHDLPALYTHPHYRVAAYMIGLLAGHYVFMLKSGKWRSPVTERAEETADASNASTASSQLLAASGKETAHAASGKARAPSWRRPILAYTGLFLFLVMSFVSYLLSHYYPASLLKHARTAAAIAYSVDHLIMSLAASLIIISMCFGQWSKVSKFLSHPYWTRISKLNYALLLLQCEAIYYQIFQFDQVPLAGTRELINILFNLLVTLYPLSFFVTLAFEFPLANMEKLLV